MLRLLTARGATVHVVMTQAATQFVTPATFRELSYQPVGLDLFAEPQHPEMMQHLHLAETADLVIVAPATANTLAKMAAGISDNLLLTLLLATQAPILVAPAMDSDMYTSPITQANLARLESFGIHIIGPDVGPLARRNVGPGRLSAPEAIVQRAADLLEAGAKGPPRADFSGSGDLGGVRVLVTAGPTQEPIDPVRYIGNRSSGKMGFALAAAAARRGANVVLISGPTSLATPSKVQRVDVRTALEMRDAVLRRLEQVDVVIKSAAVADYRVEHVAEQKIKKSAHSAGLQITLVPNPDILAEVGRRKRQGQVVVGFAAETADLLQHAAKKLAAKNCDLLVANDITEPGSGFGTDTNRVDLLDRQGGVQSLGLLSKDAVATKVLDRVADLLRALREGGAKATT